MSTTPLPLFGRVWSLQVLTAPVSGQSQQTLLDVSVKTATEEQDPKNTPLRIIFDVNMTSGLALWEATIVIYNLNPSTIGQITQGAQVSLAIGYESQGQPTEIFRGFVFQPTFEWKDCTDYVLTLQCMVGLTELVNTVVNYTAGPVTSQWQIVKDMAKSAGIDIAYIDPASSFSQQLLPRGKTIFGTPNRFFAQVAAQNNLLSFYTPQGLMIGKPTGTSATPDVIYAPPLGKNQQPSQDEASITRSLVGSPTQTENGVVFRVLGDPRLQVKLPLMQVKLDQTVIRQMAFSYGTTPQVSSLLNQDGVYYIVGVNHVGDSRGNQWYSEVIAVTSVNSLFALLGEGNSVV